MSERENNPNVESAEGNELKASPSTAAKKSLQPQQPDAQSPMHQKQKSPLLAPRSRTASAPISSTNPNVTSHPLHATNLSLSSPSTSKSSPKSSFRPHFQAATSTTPSLPSSTILRSATAVAPPAGAPPVPPLVGSVPVPKTPPRRRSKLNAHRGMLDMHLHIPVQDLSTGGPSDAPFSPGVPGRSPEIVSTA